MHFILYLKYELLTDLNKETVIDKLQLWTSKQKPFEANNPAKFWGEVFEDGFRITRRIRRGHNWNPVINGKLRAAKKGTKIKVEMSLHLVTKIFSIALLVGNFLIMLTNPNELLSSLLFILFLYLITLIFWNLEVRKSREFLDQILGFPSLNDES